MVKEQKYISKIPLINVDIIIVKHFETLLEDSSKFCFYLYFVIIPLFSAILLLLLQKTLAADSANTLITAFSIFTGLLLNVILIIFAIVDRRKVEDADRKASFEHLYANSIYALLFSTLLLLFLILLVVLNDWNNIPLVIFFSFIIYFGVVHFIMTLLMIFKRLFVLVFD